MRPARSHRSWLLTPCSDESALMAARRSGADALILDLAAGGPDRMAVREMAARFVEACGTSDPVPYVMIASVGTAECDGDVRAITAARPAGLVLCRAGGGGDVTRLAALLAAAEADAGVEDGATKILALATDTPAAVLGLATYAGASMRLAGLIWGPQRLREELGSRAIEDESGTLTTLYAHVRNQCLISAAAAGVAAIDRAEPAAGAALANACTAAWRDGFSGKIAVSPDQVTVMNAIFGD
ncbi:MAG: aldolase/citrate lyase family protein [Flavobacteriaceae bacterium]